MCIRDRIRHCDLYRLHGPSFLRASYVPFVSPSDDTQRLISSRRLARSFHWSLYCLIFNLVKRCLIHLLFVHFSSMLSLVYPITLLENCFFISFVSFLQAPMLRYRIWKLTVPLFYTVSLKFLFYTERRSLRGRCSACLLYTSRCV